MQGSIAPQQPKVNGRPELEFTFAHFSDVHLGPMPRGAIFRNFALKRLSGGLNWLLKRRHVQRPDIAYAMANALVLRKPDHVVCSGDIVNVAAYDEFPRAANYLKQFGPTERLSFVPGNHDAYVDVPQQLGLQHFAPWMGANFPYVHLRKNIAFIGLSSALPQPLFRATGELGTQQLNALAVQLADLKSKGFCRVVMIHHAPLPKQTVDRKALRDTNALETVLKTHGAECVVHGHLHMNMHSKLDTATGVCHIIGVASASSNGGHQDVATWNLFSVERIKGEWRLALQRHVFNLTTKTFEAKAREVLQ